jgi:F1F0 ATPase subunit 2
MGINPMLWAFSFIWGVLLGLFYFGGLWMTLKVMTRANKPKSWLGMSFIIRISFIMAGFWVIMKVDAVSLIFTFSAFLITRVILTRALGRERRGKIHAHQS